MRQFLKNGVELMPGSESEYFINPEGNYDNFMINYDKVQVASIRCLNIRRKYNLRLPGIFNI